MKSSSFNNHWGENVCEVHVTMSTLQKYEAVISQTMILDAV
jgi:hypothetical protein